MNSLLYITINIDPNIGQFGPFQITWHGVFTALGIAAAVVVTAWFARRRNLNEDDIYNVALWGVPGGIIGARLLYVLEHADTFIHDVPSVFSLNEGGISIYGGVIGGALVAYAYAYRKHLPIRRISDCAALGLLIGLSVGRVGDFINGEHWARATKLPWGFCYTNPNTLNGDPVTKTFALCGSAGQHPLSPPAVHPVAGVYEPALMLLTFAFCWYLFQRLNTAGYIFWISVIAYGVIRFFLSMLRINETRVGVWSVPQLIAIPMVILGILALLQIRRMAQRDPAGSTAIAPAPAPGPTLAGSPARARRSS